MRDYRTRYAYDRLDPDLQALHQQVPMIAVWDDHELANDAYDKGAQNHDESQEGAFSDRRAAALRAYREWMPIRPRGENEPLYRKFHFGDLVDVFMLDTRMQGEPRCRRSFLAAWSTVHRLRSTSRTVVKGMESPADCDVFAYIPANMRARLRPWPFSIYG